MSKEIIAASIAGAIAVVSLAVGVWQDIRVRAQDSAIAEEVRMREAADDRQTAEREAALSRLTPFLDRQMALYFAASALAGRIATSKESPEKTRATQRFKELYWGELAMVENKGVQQSTVAFWCVMEGNRIKSECLQEYKGRVAAQEEAMRSVCLRRASLDLARAARASLVETWKPGLGVLDILRDP